MACHIKATATCYLDIIGAQSTVAIILAHRSEGDFKRCAGEHVACYIIYPL